MFLAAHLSIMLLQPSVIGKADKRAREMYLAVFFCELGDFSASVLMYIM